MSNIRWVCRACRQGHCDDCRKWLWMDSTVCDHPCGASPAQPGLFVASDLPSGPCPPGRDGGGPE